MIDSLMRIRGLDFDVLVPGLFIGDNSHVTVTRSVIDARIQEIIGRLQQVEIH